MARQSGAKTYFVARKGLKVYLTDPLCVDVNSITTSMNSTSISPAQTPL